MFFPRLRRHAKWMFLLLALAFALGFVGFGVGGACFAIGVGLRFAIGIDPEGKSPKVVQEALNSGRMFFYTDRGPRLITPELLDSIRNAQRRITGEAKRDVDLDRDAKGFDPEDGRGLDLCEHAPGQSTLCASSGGS